MPIELKWPEKQTLDALDYACDMTGDLVSGETITDIAVSVKPSGTDELNVQSVALQGNVIVVWLTGGVGGRGYLVRIDVTTSAERVFDVLAVLPMSRILMPFPVPEPTSQDFSEPITYHEPVAVQAAATIAGQARLASAL
jgi:hypothetical protein